MRAIRLGLVVSSFWVALSGAAGCADDETIPLTEAPVIPPGRWCQPPQPNAVKMRGPERVALAVGQTKEVRVGVAPDFCDNVPVEVAIADGIVADALPPEDLTYGRSRVTVSVTGRSIGSTTLTATVRLTDGTERELSVAVDVLSTDPIACSASDNTSATLLEPGSEIAGTGALARAAIALPAGADRENHGSFLWSTPAFEASVTCEQDMVPTGMIALSPAVTFGPADRSFRRDIPMRLPFNPTRMPAGSQHRHVQVVYRGPAHSKPRVVAVTNLIPDAQNGEWWLDFMAPRLGTYQIVIEEDAGKSVRKRLLTYRAILGVSMGAVGTAMFGTRHHERFDAIAALGGPLDSSYLLNHFAKQYVGGFRAIAPGTQLANIAINKSPCLSDAECAVDEQCIGATPSESGGCTLIGAPTEPYEHLSTYNNLWYETPEAGNGGAFDREDYTNIFTDFVWMFGNPMSYNPGHPSLAAGVDPNHGSQVGDRTDGSCRIWVDPYDSATDVDALRELDQNCAAERCSYTQVLSNYYDGRFNPDGTFPVISFCDGSPQDLDKSPYASSWSAQGNNYPVGYALAVDYNGNGVRDELEPLIAQPHEPYDDTGSDVFRSEDEPGYSPTRLDPTGDDYDPQYNPAGTENDHEYQNGEPFQDLGIDGVTNTTASPYDFGEGDGEFTEVPGRRRFLERGPGAVIKGRIPPPNAPLDDDALRDLDVWTDGGTRDLFNSLVTARRFAGAFAARGRPVRYYGDGNPFPGLGEGESFDASFIDWEAVPPVVLNRYGSSEPSDDVLASSSGQHVGTGEEFATRIQAAMYFLSSRWANASRELVDESRDDPDPTASECEINGTCQFDFTDASGRKGQVLVNLPTGYGHRALQEERYPVVFILHGYGMEPQDLAAVGLLLKGWVNNPLYAQHQRLAKAIYVYVDGHCRHQDDTGAECHTGTFYTDSPDPNRAQVDQWWLELMDDIDKRYRTKQPEMVDWID